MIRASVLAMCLACLAGANAGQTLYNGIELPDVWPPRDRAPTREPMPVPYLDHVSDVIPIDVGRQLFVDDFLIARTTLKRTYHQAAYLPENPVLRPDRPWEEGVPSQSQPAPTAMVFSDGVWYDPQDHLFKMWYMGGYVKSTCYATSKDGIHWDKPALDVVPGTNVVHTAGRDSGTVWLDLDEQDPQRRYKMFLYMHPEGAGTLSVFFSADGVHWGDRVVASGPTGDRTTVFYNPFRKVWVYSIRDYTQDIGRFRRYWENADVIAGAAWQKGEPPFWVGADRLDPPRADLKTPCELYNLDAAAYESLMIGLFSIWRGQPKDRAKPNEICVGFSRDGFHWFRPQREAFIPVSEYYGDWNWGNVQSAGGCCLVVKDQLYFYVSGRKGVAGSPASGECATGLATLRRDGFASMDADDEGILETRPLRFTGRFLFVNIADPEGELRVEVLDAMGAPRDGFGREECVPVTIDKTCARIRWQKAEDLSQLTGQPVRFRFHLRKGRLYAFWVSADASGASRGYVAAGGPGFTGPADTVGEAATAQHNSRENGTMHMADAGWVWEGQGLDPGVFPSIFGVGEGADFFGVRKVHFLFHPTTDLVLQKLSRFEEVVCDISKWRFRNCGEGNRGTECFNDSTLETVCAEAEQLSRFSLKHPNISGGYYDDMKGLMQRYGHTAEHCAAIKTALQRHNPKLKLECVVYAHELEDRAFWQPLVPFIDVVSFWVWGYQHLDKLEDDLARCRDLFPGKPIRMGCYLRDYPTAAPMPMDAIRHQWNVVAKALADGRIQGFDILGAVTIDGQLEQALWVRDFIRAHS